MLSVWRQVLRGNTGLDCARPTGHGRSRTTLVDLIEAIARAPGTKPSSSAASVDISETIRCGPQIISTWAITVSFFTATTIPGSRLRALTEDERTASRSGESARDSARPA